MKADAKGLKRLKILFRFRNFLPIGFPVGFLSFNRMFSESWGGLEMYFNIACYFSGKYTLPLEFAFPAWYL